MWRVAVSIVVAACASPPSTAPNALPGKPPVTAAEDPPRPTLRLPKHFVPIGYTARLAIDPAKPTFTGHIEIAGELARPARTIWLHGKGLTIRAASATKDGATVPITAAVDDDVIALRAKDALGAGRWTIAIDYDGAIDQNGFSGLYRQRYVDDVYVSTQFEATAARLVFPCLDEPGFKVPWQLALDVPKAAVAISNTPVTRTDPLDAEHVRVQFAVTRPLPSYLIAFAVGPWEIVNAGVAKSGAPLRAIVPRGQTSRAAYAVQVLPKIVAYLEDWFAIPFPYPKLDVVAVPSLRGGAMENAGMITFDARNMLADPTAPSWSARFNILDTLGHETSHQWFGDLVTAAWWDDIWLNESFATWMEDRIVDALEPSMHAEHYGTSRRTWAFAADSLASARKIREPIANEGDIHNAFDGITYPKGSSVLRMFEHYVGPEKLKRAIHDYVLAHADGSATAADLVAAIGAATGVKVDAALSSFLDQAGVPMLHAELACTQDQPPHVTVSQRRYLPVDSTAARDRVWRFPVCIAFDNKGKRDETCAMLESSTGDIPLATDRCPAWTFADAGAFGYYRLALSDAAAQRVRDVAWPRLGEAERRSAFEAVRAAALDGELPIATLASFAPKLLAIDDRFSVGDALGDLSAGANGPTASGLPTGLVDSIGPALLPAAQKRVRTLVGPLVGKLGITMRPGDDFDTEAKRGDAVAAAVWAKDPRLDGAAVALASHWRDLAPGQRRLVLWIAANASPAIAKQLHADALAETDPKVRQELLAALANIRDPARHREQLDLALDPRMSSEDALTLLTTYVDDQGRAASEAWLRAHMAELKRKLPSGANDDFPIVLNFMYVISGACDGARRDEIAAYVTQEFAHVPSGERPVHQAIEWMDQCIARRKRLEPSIRAWLAP